MAFANLKFKVTLNRFAELLPRSPISATISSDATHEGFNYFFAVDRGRRGFGPKTKKLLVFEGSPNTRWAGHVYALKRVRRAKAQRLRARAVENTQRHVAQLSESYNMTRVSLVDLVNRVALVLTAQLARISPRRTGRLAKSYSVDLAQ